MYFRINLCVQVTIHLVFFFLDILSRISEILDVVKNYIQDCVIILDLDQSPFVQRVLCRTTNSSRHFAEAMVSLLLAVVVVHATPWRLPVQSWFCSCGEVKNLLHT